MGAGASPPTNPNRTPNARGPRPAVRACGLSCVLERETAQTARQGPEVRAEWQRMCVRPDSQDVGSEAATHSKSA